MTLPARGDVFQMSLGVSRGREMRKNRPCVVLSPDELNRKLGTVIVAPMTTGGHAYAFRIPCRFKKRDGFIVLDQIRTVDLSRLTRRLGRIHGTTLSRALEVLREMFAE